MTTRLLSAGTLLTICLAASCSGSIGEDPGLGVREGPGRGTRPTLGNPATGTPPAGQTTPAGMKDPAGASLPPAGADSPPPAPATGFSCDPAQKGGSRPRLWRLNDAQYARTVATLFAGRSQKGNRDLAAPAALPLPFRATIDSDRFSTLAASYAVRDQEMQEALRAAQDVAARLTSALATSPCLTTEPNFEACMQLHVREKGELLFRRPLRPEEVTKYAGLAGGAAAAAGKQAAAALAFTAMLMAPQFLFRSELGAPVATDPSLRKLTPYEIAAALSYTLTDGPPDQPLWEAARSGAAAQPATIALHVARLLEAPAELAPLRDFFAEWFHYPRARDMDKPGAYSPDDLIRDTDRFVAEALTTSARKNLLATLFTSKTIFFNNTTAPTYGLSTTSKTPEKGTAANDRTGILGQPSWLAAFAQPEHTDPIRRGRFVRESLLCREVPQIDIGAVADLSRDAKLSMREKLALHTANPSCKACHGLLDPIGLGMEAFDQYGKLRTTEAGRAVDASGTLVDSGDQDGAYKGLAELGAKLAASRTVVQCFVSHGFQYWMGRRPHTGDACALAAAERAYQQSGGDFVASVQELFTSDAFLLKRP